MLVAANNIFIRCYAQKGLSAWRERETLHKWLPAASMGCFEGEYADREKAAQYHKGIALSLFVITGILCGMSTRSLPFFQG